MGLHMVAKAEKRSDALGELAGWMLEAWRAVRARTGESRRPSREMRVLETLAVGGRKQLLLVSCAGERFLVGTGSDGVGTIVRVRPEPAALGLARSPAERM